MLAKVRSCAVIGLEGALIEVEVDLSNGLAGFMIVGLPDTALYVYETSPRMVYVCGQ